MEDFYGTPVSEAQRFGELAQRAVADGFTAFKSMPVPEQMMIEGLRPVKFAEACVAAMRTAVGDHIDIMVDCHARPSPPLADLRRRGAAAAVADQHVLAGKPLVAALRCEVAVCRAALRCVASLAAPWPPAAAPSCLALLRCAVLRRCCWHIYCCASAWGARRWWAWPRSWRA